MKVTVLRRRQGDGTVFYVSAAKNHKGVFENFSQKEVENNPTRFEVRESGSFRKTNIHEVTPASDKTLPKPLGELNELIAMLAPFRRGRSQQEIATEAQKMLDHKHLNQVKESWQALGLSPEAAEVAARVEIQKRPADLPPVTEWASLLDKAYGGRG
ncbi:MAG TPA: hypothetical protein VNX88_18630 [Terriglobales bacterium]|jgi:hypothetical protein|nr:hypothetical protein [Terriglobales bacterium]